MFSRLLLGVLSTLHSRGLRTDFHAQYVKRLGSMQGCAFRGLENQKKLTFISSFSRKTAILGPGFDESENFRPKTVLQWGMLNVNTP